MKKNSSSITIILASRLADFFNPQSARALDTVKDKKIVSSLERFLSFANKSTNHADNIFTTLFQQFNTPTNASIPVAAISRFATADSASDEIWACVDAIHMEPDRDNLLRLDPSLMQITEQEARVIIDALNSQFSDRGMLFLLLSPDRWVVRLRGYSAESISAINTEVGLRHGAFIATNEVSRIWSAILNEIQMLLFSLALNESRESSGQYTINSVSMWGAGPLPPASENKIACIVTEDLFSLGLAKLNGVEIKNLPSLDKPFNFDSLSGDLLYVDSELADDNPLNKIKFISNLISTAEAALHIGQVKQIKIIAKDSIYSANKYSYRKFWRRIKPLHYWLPDIDD